MVQAAQVVERAPTRLQRPMRVLLRMARDTIEVRLPGLAAETAFWVLLSLPALVLSIAAAFGVIGQRMGPDWEFELTDRVAEVASIALTPSTIDNTIRPLFHQLFEEGGVGLVSIAFVAALWTASRAVKTVLQAVTLVAASDDLRDGWKDRLLGFGITISGMVVGVIIAPLVVAGPGFGEQIERWIGIDALGIAAVWRVAWWPVVFAGATVALATLFHVGIPGTTRWRDQLPGAMFATVAWLVGSAGLRVYAANFMTADSVYGPMAGPIVGLLWLWVAAFAVLLGAELNAALDKTEREHAS